MLCNDIEYLYDQSVSTIHSIISESVPVKIVSLLSDIEMLNMLHR